MVECGKILGVQNNQLIVLPCSDRCAKVARNKKVAEALEIDLVNTPFKSLRIEYSESLVKFAFENWTFVRNIEAILIDLVENKKEVHYFSTAKPRHNAHLSHYADYFGFASEIVDEDRKGKGSVIIRKKVTSDLHLPTRLLSHVAQSYDKSMFPEQESIEKLSKYHGIAINCILIESITLDILLDDLQVLLTPLFGHGVVIVLKQIINPKQKEEDKMPLSDFIIGIQSRNGEHMEIMEMEEVLMRVLTRIKQKFVCENEWAKDVRLCWVDKKGKVQDEQNEECIEHVSEPVYLTTDSPMKVANQFDVLKE